jgi:hypothetical protein
MCHGKRYIRNRPATVRFPPIADVGRAATLIRETEGDVMSRGAKWGYAAACIVGLPIFAFLLAMDALGDCDPGTVCRKGFILMVLAPSALIAGAVGLLVWFFVTRSAPR